MQWDRFFEDLEDQLDSEWEAERAALDTEAERLRLSRVTLRERLVAVSRTPHEVSAHLVDGTVLVGHVARVGADWCAVLSDARSGIAGAAMTNGTGGTRRARGADGPSRQASVVPLAALAGIGAEADAVLSSVRDADPGSALGQRMGLGFVLRDLVRRRSAVTVHLAGGRTLSGTIDRAGADHLDLALHEPGAPRRQGNVTGYRVIPFGALILVRLADASDLA
ncbi:hypothetical protein [Microbacterium flavum]|uniref:Fis family transcriptional regulator n=1 Tax=Microbacterium flavum TaxID=415216 RepID=A0ABS5XV06_9MICO|nr:hypothetical protein [Microbacterium flavum]MBT8798256.1 hypothetical protein [Microbacterium flavum]